MMKLTADAEGSSNAAQRRATMLSPSADPTENANYQSYAKKMRHAQLEEHAYFMTAIVILTGIFVTFLTVALVARGRCDLISCNFQDIVKPLEMHVKDSTFDLAVCTVITMTV